MQDSPAFNWLHSAPSTARPVGIKVESSTVELAAFSSLSPPSSPPRSVLNYTSALPSPTPTRRRSNTSALASPKRVKPYPISTRESRLWEESAQMADNPSYGTWSGARGGSKQHYSTDQAVPVRRSSDGDQQAPSYTLPNAFVHHSFTGRPSIRDPRPQSSSSSMTTSSLTGAMGDAHLSSHSQHSDSPSPTSDQPFGVDMHAGMVWQHQTQSAPSQTLAGSSSSHTSYPTGVPGQSGGHLPYHAFSSTGSYVPYQDYNHSTTYHNPSPESHSPHSPAFPSSSYTAQQMSFQPGRAQLSVQTRPNPHVMQPQSENYAGSSSMTVCQPSPTGSTHMQNRPPTRTTQERYEDEILHLRKNIRDLELINESARRRIRQLETELANDIPMPSASHASTSSALGGLPSPYLTPSPQSSTFHTSWKARTDARIRQFCSLNRAGNALCAWHDSRRERRAHPPRMAPPGHLNCGCTHDEALFEESLARHGVGSYHPGETVRMDPALRNPLLKLLEQRYGYRDGDFERDPATGNWIEGEGPSYWEARALSGAPHTRKSRAESDRR